MARPPGLSVRLKLTLSYVGLLLVAVALLLGIVWVFLLRYVPANAAWTSEGFTPGRGDLLRAFAPALGWVLLALLVVGLAGGWFLAGRVLAPLRRLTAATRQAAAGSLSHRIELEGPDDEFRELADSFDDMLARLEAHLAEQQRFAANASHELRTPLAITQTMLEVARDDPDGRDPALVERLLAVNARAIELTEALLLLSRADGRAFVRERVDLSLLAEEAAETLLPLAERRGVTLETSGEAAFALGSPALLLQLTVNLVHNAIVHNAPEGGWVRVRSGRTGGRADLIVENGGEPLDPGFVATLAEPFQRGAERTRGDHAGVGLGLAIATSIVRAHDGRLDLAPREGGGLVAAVHLPAAAPDVRGAFDRPDDR
ncbi:sensor histidine kinase [Agromyces seonyuensis]|uniref:histidine kinase n=1 Tax=Agromyces seonyuensis TaxID=2662446 RepID=A0A6I4P7Z3_9MICO|nr:HAMP domain-containing sensor histidine kinase [Agromyces seonyuensis]MWC00055.1 HAMP domain-containing protein [Agromyces seonyuensis]